MKCPHCHMEFHMGLRKDFTRPLFALLILLLVVSFFLGIRLRGENEDLKSNIIRLEKKIDYYESTLVDYQKAIEQFIQRTPEKKR